MTDFRIGELVWFVPSDPDSREILMPGYYEVIEKLDAVLRGYKIENDYHGFFWVDEDELTKIEYDRDDGEGEG